VDLIPAGAGGVPDRPSMLSNAQINYDLNMHLQYMTGLGLKSGGDESIRQPHRTF
jgi:hypothetical protein